jgi:enoyl-[acyl-carrier-protein] reductase (NADH)
VRDFNNIILKDIGEKATLRRNITQEEVGGVATFFQ